MTHVIILDTYDYAKALKKANVPEAHIEVEIARDKERTKTINEAINNNLSTKYDISLLQKDIFNVESSLKRDIKVIEERVNNLEKNLSKWGWILTFVLSVATFLITFYKG